MMVVYIAGPFRAPTAWGVEQNVRAAEAVGLDVAKAGAMPLIPHCNTRFFDGELTDQFWIDGTLALLAKCDAVLMLPNWRQSAGARGEHDWAATRMPVLYSIDDLRDWLLIQVPR